MQEDMLKELGETISNAEDAEELEKILEEQIGEKHIEWKPLGNKPNNYGIVHNQAASPMPALVELVVNSFDAELLKQYDDGSDESYDTAREAANALLDGDEMVNLRADGFKGRGRGKSTWNFKLQDKGMGQTQELFEDRFLGLLEPGSVKREYNFIQGKFGMGSSGSLRFCESGYKFIASASHAEKGQWSWSLTRENLNEHRYEFLTIDGEIPRFTGDFNPGEAMDTAQYGTVIKLFNYDLKNSSRITEGRFRREFEKWLCDPVIPTNLIDYRGRDEHTAATKGLQDRIAENNELVKHSYTIQKNFGERLGTRDITAVVFHSEDERKKLIEDGIVAKRLLDMNEFYTSSSDRVLLTVNGQSHYMYSMSPLKTKCELPRTAEDMFVFVDLSDVRSAEFSNLFQSSRDSLVDTELRRTLEDGLFEALREHDGLREEEAERREKMNTSGEKETIAEEDFEELLSNNPDVSEFFETGTYASAQKGSSVQTVTEDIDYEGTVPPSELYVIDTYTNRSEYEPWTGIDNYEIEMPVNDNARVRMALNAPNGYLGNERSSFEIKPDDTFDRSSLQAGVFSLTVQPWEDCEVGDTRTVHVRISDKDLDRPLRASFDVRVTEAVEDEEESTSTSSNSGVSLPPRHVLNTAEWAERGYHEDDIVRVVGVNYDDMDIFINGGAAPFENFIENNSINPEHEDKVLNKFVNAVHILTLSAHIEHKQRNVIEEGNLNEAIQGTVRGQAQILLTQLVSNAQIHDWS